MAIAWIRWFPILSALALAAQADKDITDVDRLNFARHDIGKRSVEQKLLNQELRVVTIPTTPYTMLNLKADGSVEYTGFIPDLMFQLSQRFGFKFTFYTSNVYGRYDNTTGEWNGMIGEVIKKSRNSSDGADLAAAPLTITAGRERVVNFVKPFQHLGISVVIKRPDLTADLSEFPFNFNIFQPFEPSVWAVAALALIVVGLFLWLMNLYNPYEWARRGGTEQANEYQSKLFNLPGSLWFAYSSLQWQGFEKSPRSIASKFLAGVWFFFVTIFLVTYTAGIMNHLFWASMVHRTISTRSHFVDLAHLISNKDYAYGTLSNSQTYKYLTEVAAGEEFQVMRRYWETVEGQAQLVPSVEAGLERVRRGKYAFIMESMMAKYYMNKRPCDLTTVGEQFAMRSYGFALPIGSPILEEMHSGILEMAEEGDLEELERKWFVDDGECWNVTYLERAVADANSQLSVNKPKSVDLSMFLAPILILAAGIIIASGIALVEIIYFRKWGRFTPNNFPQGQQLKMDPFEGNM